MRIAMWLTIFSGTVAAGGGAADDLVFDDSAAWNQWSLMPGVVEVGAEGQLHIAEWPAGGAPIVLRSIFFDLEGAQPLRLNWDAELPAGTRLEIRSRAGDGFEAGYTFRDKAGDEVTENRFYSLPKVLRGAVDTVLVADAGWQPWSPPYRQPGEVFRSGPGRFIQLEMTLASEDAARRPVVRSLAVELETSPTAVRRESWAGIKRP